MHVTTGTNAVAASYNPGRREEKKLATALEQLTQRDFPSLVTHKSISGKSAAQQLPSWLPA